MAIPSEYNEHPNPVGATNIKHPIITFRVLMKRQLEESIGPVTNTRTGTVLHPDMHDSDEDRGRANVARHETQFSPLIPGFLCGQNIVRNDDGTFTAYGEQAVYLKTNYADIANPLLEVTNSAPYVVA